MTKAIQLTNIDKSAIWIDKQGNKIPMSDLDDKQLQDALEVTQGLRTKAFMSFKAHSRRELQVKQEAKNRNMEIKGLGHAKNHWVAAKFCELEDAMNSAYASILRKIKVIKEKV